ncbi:MAG: hypothetical protein IPN86_04475 [Saprospiraceae bacterium]|nr:hypothetical protein [Saprospiraceae bacterium]
MVSLTPVAACTPSRELKGPLAKDFNGFHFILLDSFLVGSEVDQQFVLVNYDKKYI